MTSSSAGASVVRTAGSTAGNGVGLTLEGLTGGTGATTGVLGAGAFACVLAGATPAVGTAGDWFMYQTPATTPRKAAIPTLADRAQVDDVSGDSELWRGAATSIPPPLVADASRRLPHRQVSILSGTRRPHAGHTQSDIGSL
jgi:hypothetical protein